MTPYESRETFIDSMFSSKELEALKQNGVYQRYVYGEISIDEICKQMKDQGV